MYNHKKTANISVRTTSHNDILLRELRSDIIRMAHHSGHVAVALSCVDILAALYLGVMNCSPANIADPDRDRFILSKGHGCMALYAVLAHTGFIDKTLLDSYAQDGSTLAEHPVNGKVPGIECATGSLGHGLSIGAGMAESIRLRASSARVFVLLGDGECNEGSVWEAAALASARKLHNLVAIVDLNGLQACGSCSNISSGTDLIRLWQGSGWKVCEANGHDYEELVRVLGNHSESEPRVVICHTVKGKGIPVMEHDLEWHYRPVRGEAAHQALEYLRHA